LDELHTYEEDHSNALCPIDEERSGSHMGENIEIQPMTTAEMRQYFNEHYKTTHQLGLQLNQLMISVSSHHSPLDSPQTTRLTGPGMVSFITAAGSTVYS
jgi:hypothetical protein